MDKEHKETVDRLSDMFRQQTDFMDFIHVERNFPKHPVDLTTKEGQKIVKDISHDCMHELFEAIHLLKNSKQHRKTNVSEFDRESFVEEISDAMHYLIEICILSGISHEEMYEEFTRKSNVNFNRIKKGY